MDKDLEQELARLSKNLKPGEVREDSIDRTRISSDDKSKVIAKVLLKPSYEEEFLTSIKEVGQEKIITLPFAAHTKDDDKDIIRGTIDVSHIKRVKDKKRHFSLKEAFVARLKEEWDRIITREDYLDHIYIDEKGREFELIDGIRTYLDDRGFDYYVKVDADGREIEYVILTDGSVASFLDEDRTIIKVGDKAYRFDGNICYDEEVDFIYPHR